MSDAATEAVGAAGPYGIAGAIVFAVVKLGPPLARLISYLHAIWEQREIRQEQEERRARRRRRIESTHPPIRGSMMPTLDAAPEAIEDEKTGLTDVREFVRKRSPGLRTHRKGTHHDGEGE